MKKNRKLLKVTAIMLAIIVAGLLLVRATVYLSVPIDFRNKQISFLSDEITWSSPIVKSVFEHGKPDDIRKIAEQPTIEFEFVSDDGISITAKGRFNIFDMYYSKRCKSFNEAEKLYDEWVYNQKKQLIEIYGESNVDVSNEKFETVAETQLTVGTTVGVSYRICMYGDNTVFLHAEIQY